MSSGNKYHRRIRGLSQYKQQDQQVVVDVYSVLTAFDVTHPALAHAAKKILCAGLRNKASKLQDLTEAVDAINRAIEDCKMEKGNES